MGHLILKTVQFPPANNEMSSFLIKQVYVMVSTSSLITAIIKSNWSNKHKSGEAEATGQGGRSKEVHLRWFDTNRALPWSFPVQQLDEAQFDNIFGQPDNGTLQKLSKGSCIHAATSDIEPRQCRPFFHNSRWDGHCHFFACTSHCKIWSSSAHLSCRHWCFFSFSIVILPCIRRIFLQHQGSW